MFSPFIDESENSKFSHYFSLVNSTLELASDASRSHSKSVRFYAFEVEVSGRNLAVVSLAFL